MPAWIGRKQAAVELLRQAFGEGLEFDTNLHYSLDLEPPRDYPPLQELLKPRG